MRAILTCLVLLMFLSGTSGLYSQNNSANNSEIKRVRIDVETPLGYVRHLLIGFTPDNAATDGFDYGYDAPNIENFPDDASWIIEGNPYTTQGVGAFDDMKKYPIGLFLSNAGTIRFSLLALENFEEPIGVYIYDDLLDQYFKINQFDHPQALDSGVYTNRFFLAFRDHNSSEENLSISESELNRPSITYHRSTSVLKINTTSGIPLNSLTIHDLNGKLIYDSKFNGVTRIIETIKLSSSSIFVFTIGTINAKVQTKVILP